MNLEIIFYLVFLGLLGGFLSGMFGIGGGIVMVPLMIFLLGYTQHQAQGTSLAVLSVPVAFLAAYTYYKSGENVVNWKFALVIAASFIVGGFLGSKVAIGIDGKLLKKIFSVVMMVAAIKIFFSK